MTADTWLSEIDSRLAMQLRFLLEADRLKSVLRGSRVIAERRHENTAEHSWHLSLFAVVLQEWAVGPVDVARVIQMLILHDLVEIECGDTPLFLSDAGQDEREREAADKIFGHLPPEQGLSLRALWEEFEAAATADAKFAKALDRFQPILQNHAVGGGTWTDYAIDVEREKTLTRRIADGAPTLWSAAEIVYAEAVAKGWLRPKPEQD